jgi:nanoRNase/pAp phosphatase (c-di-AMP/oligoRNAs hydrolase)
MARLRAAAGRGPVLILTHDTPDPDALASGMALARLLREAWGIPSRLVYSGLIARAENLAMLRHLTPAWEHADELTGLEQYSAVALVDTQPTAGNNRLPPGSVPGIVIDHHHPIREALGAVACADVRPEVAATVTLVYQYLQAAGVVPDPPLATAMFYGLHADTRGLSRGASPLDEAVYVELLGRLDRALLIRVEQAGLPQVYFSALCRGLHAARIYGRSVVADLGQMHRPDLMAEMADLLIRLEGARAALCLGRYEDALYLSLRTVPLGRDAGLLIQEIVLPFGAGGGHGLIAGGKITLNGQEVDSLVAQIEQRFLALMGDAGQPQSLVAEATLMHPRA